MARIEAGAAPEVLAAAIAGHVAALMDRLDGRAPDSVILGCTHYPLVAQTFAAALPVGVPMHSQPALVAASLTAYLARHPEFDAPAGPRAPTRFLTTGNPETAGALAARFFGTPPIFQAA